MNQCCEHVSMAAQKRMCSVADFFSASTKIVEQANLAESSHSTGQEPQIVTLRDAEIQTDDVEAEPVVKEVEWVSKQLDLPDVDSDSDYGKLTVTLSKDYYEQSY